LKKFRKKITIVHIEPMKSIFSPILKTYSRLSDWGKILLFVLLLLIMVAFFRFIKFGGKEGFEASKEYTIKTGTDVYDDFYSDLYDHLVYNKIKDDYEIGEIVNQVKPTNESVILDVGSGTGHHVSELASKGFNVVGLDDSQAMVKKSKENYPNEKFMKGNALSSNIFQENTFTHILCLYFTLYYFKDKMKFFNNCMKWLMPGGTLIIHVVNREMFDPILPPGNPLLLVSAQKYAKERITKTKVVFNDMDYVSNFDYQPDQNMAFFREKFVNKETGVVRKNEHHLYMETEDAILTMAQNAGFIVQGKIDLIKCHYEYQYLYILVKPN